MSLTIRQAVPTDAPQWLELLVATAGQEYPAREVYDPAWAEAELASGAENETWVAEQDGILRASISLLGADSGTNNPVANLGRALQRPESIADGSAAALLAHVTMLAEERKQMAVARVPAASADQQKLYSDAGYACAGYQPLKHILQTRQGILFYVRASEQTLLRRGEVRELPPGVQRLARLAFENLALPAAFESAGGIMAYPPSLEVEVFEATAADYDMWRQQAGPACLPSEVSTGFNRGCGLLRTRTDAVPRAFLARRAAAIIGGVAFIHDEVDRCVRILDAFATESLAMGPLLERLVRMAHEQLGAAYLEMDLLFTASRLIRTAERFGFEPVACLPGFFRQKDSFLDVVKMVKLNILYDSEYTPLTEAATAIVRTVDHHFEAARHGLAIVSLLRALPIFAGLGDGELAKIARLFSQRLYRAGEVIFKKGDEGTQACVVMRGQVGIYLSNPSQPISTVQAGQIIGELTFLDNAPRAATAVANSSSIVLIIERSAFEELIRDEPYMGLVVMRNIALDLSRKLRRSNINRPG